MYTQLHTVAPASLIDGRGMNYSSMQPNRAHRTKRSGFIAVALCVLSRALIAMGHRGDVPGGHVPTNIWTGETLSRESLHYLMSQVKLSFSLLISWHFISPKHIFYCIVDKEASTSGALDPLPAGLCPWTLLGDFRPQTLCYPAMFLKLWRQVDAYTCCKSNSITLSGRRQVRIWSQTSSELEFGLSSSSLAAS